MIYIFMLAIASAGVDRPAKELGIYESKEDECLEVKSKYIDVLIRQEELKELVYDCCYEQMDLMQKERFLKITKKGKANEKESN